MDPVQLLPGLPGLPGEPPSPCPSPPPSPPPAPHYPSSDSDGDENSTDDDFRVFSPPSSDYTTSGFSSPGSAFHEPAVSPVIAPPACEALPLPLPLQPQPQSRGPPHSPPRLHDGVDHLLQRVVFSRPAPGHLLLDELRDAASGTSRRLFQPVPGSAFSRVYTVERRSEPGEDLHANDSPSLGNLAGSFRRASFAVGPAPNPTCPLELEPTLNGAVSSPAQSPGAGANLEWRRL